MSIYDFKILVVDDDANVLRLLRSALNSFGWSNLFQASDGVEALEVAQTVSPDLVVTDVIMPGLDGYGLLRKLRESPETAHIPVLMLTARQSGVETDPQAELYDCLPKPFALSDLREKVERLLSIKR